MNPPTPSPPRSGCSRAARLIGASAVARRRCTRPPLAATKCSVEEGADARRLVDATDVLVGNAPQILAEEDRLHLPLLGLVHVEGLPVEELDVADPRVER